MTSCLSALSKWSLLLGNLLEHYDTALFTLLSPFLASLFFPEQDPVTALILTYCIIPLGMIARPLGSLIFGYIGDVQGRRKALILSLFGMAMITGLMGFLPTYNRAGIIAPILLAMSRIFQNFFASGEIMGGAIYLIENSPESHKNMMSSFYSASSIAGILLASVNVSLFYAFNIMHEYWRILYFFGFLTAGCVVFLRSQTLLKPLLNNLSPVISFKIVMKSCWNMRQALIAIAIASGFSYASYTLSLVLMNGFIPLVNSVSEAEMMYLNTFLLGADFLLLPLFGLLTNYFSREKMMVVAGLLAMLLGVPLFWKMESASFLNLIFIRMILVVIGVWFSAPLHAWSQTLVPHSMRYTIISFGYALGSQILGGPTAAISLWLFQKTDWIVSVGFYWMILGLCASYIVLRQEVVSEESVNYNAI